MFMQIEATPTYTACLDSLNDLAGCARIQARVARLAAGNLGQHCVLEGGVHELKIHAGPGYHRVLNTAWKRADHFALRRRQIHAKQRHKGG